MLEIKETWPAIVKKRLSLIKENLERAEKAGYVFKVLSSYRTRDEDAEAKEKYGYPRGKSKKSDHTIGAAVDLVCSYAPLTTGYLVRKYGKNQMNATAKLGFYLLQTTTNFPARVIFEDSIANPMRIHYAISDLSTKPILYVSRTDKGVGYVQLGEWDEITKYLAATGDE